MQRESSNRSRKSQAGQTLVEFTLGFVIFLLLMFMTIEGARLIFDYGSVSHAARAGVRYAIVRGSSSTCPGCPATAAAIESVVRNNASGINLTKVEVCWWKKAPDCTANPADPNNKGPGSTVQVRAAYDFKPVVGLVPSGKVTVSSTAQMAISQ